jgi:hypothetical protein
LWPVGEGEAPLPFFTETLPSETPKIHQENHWAIGMHKGLHKGSQSGIEAAHRTNKTNMDKRIAPVAGCEELVELSQNKTNFNLKDDLEDPFYDDNEGGEGNGHADGTFSQPPAVETMQTTKRNSSAFQDLMPLYQSVTRLVDGNAEAKRLLYSKLQDAEIEIHQMIANKQKRKNGVVEANFVSCLPETDKSRSSERHKPFYSPQKRKK